MLGGEFPPALWFIVVGVHAKTMQIQNGSFVILPRLTFKYILITTLFKMVTLLLN